MWRGDNKPSVGHAASNRGTVAFAVAVAIMSGAAGAADLDEVVVTARKRAESIQDVPVAVTAMSAESMRRQQFQSLKDANFSVPNLSAFNNQTTVVSAATFIRGVGQDDSTPVQEQGVATYIDDVYMPRAQGGLLDLLDFERIEVLRGPQGTLYGRNSSGGAVKYVTRKPSLTDTAVIAQATVGSFERRDLAASFSAPLVDGKLAAKVDVVSRDRDGYIAQRSTGKDLSRIDRDTARLALRWQASDTVLVDVAVDGTRDRSGLQGGTPIEPKPGGKLPGGYAPIYGDLYTSGADVEDLNEFDGWGASATVTWDNAVGQFKSVSSYRTWDTVFWSDLGGRPANLDLFSDMDGKTFTQEFQLASSGDGKLKWVVGAFLMQEKLDILNRFLFLHDYVQDTDSMAVYGELTYPFTDRLRLTVGGRLTEDKKEISMFGVGLGGTFRKDGLKIDFNDFTPKVALDFSLSDDALIYASAQDGYKAGAFQGFPQQLTDLTVEYLRPESVRAYEVGAKTSWLDGDLTLNGALFLSEYDRKQLNIFNPATLGFVSRTTNAEMSGVEIELAWRPSENLTINGFLATFDGEITKSNAADPLLPKKGTKIAFMPDISAKLGFDYSVPRAGGGEFFVGGSVQHVGKIYFAVYNDPQVVQKPYELVDARIGYRAADDRLEIALGGRNLTDEEYAYTASAVDGGTLWMAEPRTWSLSFRYQLAD